MCVHLMEQSPLPDYRLVWGKNSYCGWVPGCWLSGVWWFQGSPSGIVSMQFCQLRSSEAKTVVVKTIGEVCGVFGGKSPWGPPDLSVSHWRCHGWRDPLGFRSAHRCPCGGDGIVSGAQVPMTWPWSRALERGCLQSNSSSGVWGTGWLTAVVALVSEMQGHAKQPWSWGLEWGTFIESSSEVWGPPLLLVALALVSDTWMHAKQL